MKIPHAAVTLIDLEQQYFRCKSGYQSHSFHALCGFSIRQPYYHHLIILDTFEDSRFSDLCLHGNENPIRFFASMVIMCQGIKIGTFSIMDVKPHSSFDYKEQILLAEMAETVATFFHANSHRMGNMNNDEVNLMVSMTHSLQAPLSELNDCCKQMTALFIKTDLPEEAIKVPNEEQQRSQDGASPKPVVMRRGSIPLCPKRAVLMQTVKHFVDSTHQFHMIMERILQVGMRVDSQMELGRMNCLSKSTTATINQSKETTLMISLDGWIQSLQQGILFNKTTQQQQQENQRKKEKEKEKNKEKSKNPFDKFLDSIEWKKCYSSNLQLSKQKNGGDDLLLNVLYYILLQLYIDEYLDNHHCQVEDETPADIQPGRSNPQRPRSSSRVKIVVALTRNQTKYTLAAVTAASASASAVVNNIPPKDHDNARIVRKEEATSASFFGETETSKEPFCAYERKQDPFVLSSFQDDADANDNNGREVKGSMYIDEKSFKTRADPISGATSASTAASWLQEGILTIHILGRTRKNRSDLSAAASSIRNYNEEVNAACHDVVLQSMLKTLSGSYQRQQYDVVSNGWGDYDDDDDDDDSDYEEDDDDDCGSDDEESFQEVEDIEEIEKEHILSLPCVFQQSYNPPVYYEKTLPVVTATVAAASLPAALPIVVPSSDVVSTIIMKEVDESIVVSLNNDDHGHNDFQQFTKEKEEENSMIIPHQEIAVPMSEECTQPIKETIPAADVLHHQQQQRFQSTSSQGNTTNHTVPLVSSITWPLSNRIRPMPLPHQHQESPSPALIASCSSCSCSCSCTEDHAKHYDHHHSIEPREADNTFSSNKGGLLLWDQVICSKNWITEQFNRLSSSIGRHCFTSTSSHRHHAIHPIVTTTIMPVVPSTV